MADLTFMSLLSALLLTIGGGVMLDAYRSRRMSLSGNGTYAALGFLVLIIGACFAVPPTYTILNGGPWT